MYRTYDINQSKRLLTRKRLHTFIDEMDSSDVIIIEAVGGAGKTQTVLSYIAEKDIPAIWFPFTMLDNNPDHFWEQFGHSLRTLDDTLLDYVTENRDFPHEFSSLHQFITVFSRYVYQEKEFIMVFDDCHLIKEPVVRDFVRNLIFAKIENMRIFLLSRNEALISANDRLAGIRCAVLEESQLAFTCEEIAEYFSYVRHPLTDQMVETVYRQTKGWPIAVYLLALALHNDELYTDPEQQFTTGKIFEVIDQEIFSRYSQTDQQILIQLSLLEYLPVKFLEVIYDRQQLAVVLENPFMKFNKHTYSYQFHQMFLEFLQSKQEMLTTQAVENFYRLAGQWFVEQHLYIDSLQCYTQLRDYNAIWQIFEKLAFTPVGCNVESAEMLLEALENFPLSFVEKTEFSYRRAYLSIILGRFDEAIQMYEKTADMLKFEHDQELIMMRGECLLQIGFLYMLKGDLIYTEYFKKASRLIPYGSERYKDKIMILLNGDPVSLHHGQEGEMDKWVKSLEENEERMDMVLHGNMYGFAAISRAQAEYYRMNIEESEKNAMLALFQGREKKNVDIVGCAYFLLIKISLYRGDYHKAISFIEALNQYVRSENWNYKFNQHDLAAGFFFVRLSQPNRIPDWIISDNIYSSTLSRDNYGLERIIKADYMMNQKEYKELKQYLDEIEEIFIHSTRFTALIYVNILKAIVYFQTEEFEMSARYLHHAWQMTWPNQIIMPFIEYGKYMKTMTDFFKERALGAIPEDWYNLIGSHSQTYGKRINGIRQQYFKDHPSGHNYEPLTKREVHVLSALGHGLTREEIAAELFISNNTVKNILNTIYTKLGAINGTHAVKIAMLNHII